jgi:DNA-binding PadR family transcriptional regulator
MHHAGIARPRPLIVAHVLLSLAEQPRHGYELAESLRAAEFEGVTASTVYRELAKLDAQGLVRSFWQSSQTRGPARHMYELTDEGRKDLADCADDIRRLRSHLADFLSTWASLDGAGQPPLPAPAAVGPPSRRPAGALSRLWKPR